MTHTFRAVQSVGKWLDNQTGEEANLTEQQKMVAMFTGEKYVWVQVFNFLPTFSVKRIKDLPDVPVGYDYFIRLNK